MRNGSGEMMGGTQEIKTNICETTKTYSPEANAGCRRQPIDFALSYQPSETNYLNKAIWIYKCEKVFLDYALVSKSRLQTFTNT